MAKNIKEMTRMYGGEYLAICGLAKYFPTMNSESSVFFVNGNTGNDNAADNGQLPDAPLKTLTKAISLCTDNKNDYIFVLDYYQVTVANGETWPININKNQIHIIGVTNGAFTWPWIQPPADTAAMVVTAAYGPEIAGLEFGAGASAGCINVTANGSWGTYIHDCQFGSSTVGMTGKYGISITGSGEMIHGRISNCKFGAGLSDAGIYVSSNGSNTVRGLVIKDNLFRVPATGDIGIEIATACDFDEGGIIDNKFIVVAEVGAAVTAASGVHGLLDGNVAVTDNNATNTTAEVFRTVTGANGMSWGKNYMSGTLLATEANYIA